MTRGATFAGSSSVPSATSLGQRPVRSKCSFAMSIPSNICVAAVGATQLHVTLYATSALAAERVRPMIPAFAAAYATFVGTPSIPPRETMLIRRPYFRRATQCRAAARVVLKVPLR